MFFLIWVYAAVIGSRRKDDGPLYARTKIWERVIDVASDSIADL